LGDLKVAYELATEAGSEQKWKQLAELATAESKFGLAQECLHKAQDFGGLLLLATSAGCSELCIRFLFKAPKIQKGSVQFLKK
jgi:coatomer subunit beta'